MEKTGEKEEVKPRTERGGWKEWTSENEGYFSFKCYPREWRACVCACQSVCPCVCVCVLMVYSHTVIRLIPSWPLSSFQLRF